MKKKVLILSFTSLTSDSRIQRQINALETDYDLIVCANNADRLYTKFIASTNVKLNFRSITSVFRIILVPLAWLIHFIGWEYFKNRFFNWMRYWSVDRLNLFNLLSKEDYNLIISNDLDTLPIAAELKKKKSVPLIFDAHEFYPKQFEQNIEWVKKEQYLINYICFKYIKTADAVFTVSEGLVSEFKNVFNVNPVLITNANSYKKEIKPSPVSREKIRLVHHGGAIRYRNIERMIKVAELLGSNYLFDLYLLPIQKKYIEELKEIANNVKNVSIKPAIEVNELVNVINQYDIGLYILEPVNFNHLNALPNKLFEFIQARVAIAIGPSPEMEKIVQKYNIGVVGFDFRPESLAGEISKLSAEDIERFKSNTEKAAFELNAEKNTVLMQNEVEKLLERNA